MSAGEIGGFVTLFGAGLLAGEELVVRYGVRGPVASLDDRAHIVLRQGLIRTLRIVVPALYLPTLALAIAVTILERAHAGLVFRCVAVAALLCWIAVTLGGTVPINEAALEWSPTAPPADWRAKVDRWERLNSIRVWLAVGAFAALLTSAALDANAK